MAGLSSTPRTQPSAEAEAASWLAWLRAKIPTERAAVLLVLIAGALLFFPYLGTLGLWDPWETHYGEVARAMIARDDYVYPYWESAYFFSKPALPMWLMALGMLAVGAENPSDPNGPLGSLAEWGIRLPFALIAILSMWAVYRIGRQIKDRATGLMAAFVLGTSAQFIFIGKQAMVDMPLVGLMTAGLALFIAGVFDEHDDARAEPRLRWITAAGIAAALFPQLIAIGREMKSTVDYLAVGGAGALGLGFIAFVLLKASRRDCWLAGFYVFVGLAALAKGLAVLAVVGPTVVLYMFLTLDFDVLRRSKVLWGGVLFLLIAAPWYVTLSLFKGRDDEGKTFVERFWMHDNFGRVGQGVHGDRGGLGYFAEQLAYGMFPWIAVLPHSLGLAARMPDDVMNQRRRRILLFVLIWAVWTYVFFSMGQTKFHHYIFPAVPALAVLVGVWFVHVAEAPEERLPGYSLFLIAALFAMAFRDLFNDPQNLVNLFTYKYDRDYPRELEPRPWILGTAIVGLAPVLLLVLARAASVKIELGKWFQQSRPKANALLGLALVALLFGTWISHHHFNMLSPHWSQAHLFKTYYAERKGNEPIYAYQLNWRGETFYSRNRVLQVKEAGANERMRSLVDKPGREFIITEQSRFQTLKGVLSPDKRDKLQIIDKSTNKFYLCVVEE
ncbi:glycosyltransferase family 39 protein [Myxococcota bacterium]|nr:glycosyltransferase family 39 protein [Myxococcota bacterium]